MQEIISDLDKNLDGTMDFEEFVAMVTQLTVSSTSFFQDYTPVIIKCGHMRDEKFHMLLMEPLVLLWFWHFP